MPEDGVIKFTLRHLTTGALPRQTLGEIDAWRRILHALGFIGKDPNRYGGHAYGNISCRHEAGGAQFIISGSQTGGLTELGAEHYTLVRECRPEENLVLSEGPVHPSAESLTHGMLYALDPSMRYVMHAHSPVIWRHAVGLGMALTAESADYGSPQMAAEIAALQRAGRLADGIFAMGGHQDGIVAFGATAQSAACTLMIYLAKAFQADAWK